MNGMFSGNSTLRIGDVIYQGEYKNNCKQGYGYLYSTTNEELLFEGDFDKNIPVNLGTVHLNSSLKVLIRFTNEIPSRVIFLQKENECLKFVS